MAKNEFWVVRANPKWGHSHMMFNAKPSRATWYMNEIWVCRHGECYLSEKSSEKFDDVTFYSEPVRVRLVRSDRKEPDFYVERFSDCLFINNRIETTMRTVKVRRKGLFGLIFKWKRELQECKRVPHCHRISNKLFPEITSADGIVGMDIERI